jgi:hypothetical protein
MTDKRIPPGLARLRASPEAEATARRLWPTRSAPAPRPDWPPVANLWPTKASGERLAPLIFPVFVRAVQKADRTTVRRPDRAPLSVSTAPLRRGFFLPIGRHRQDIGQ